MVPVPSECFNLLCLNCVLGGGSAVGLFNMKIWVRTKRRGVGGGGGIGKPTRWKSTPPPPHSADFQTNIMITIF